MQIGIKAKSFKRIDNPIAGILKTQRYIFLCDIWYLKKYKELENWMNTNPREQSISSTVSKKIRESLNDEDNDRFHEQNRGMLFSVDDITYNNRTEIVTMNFEDFDLHGNIDGGHTLKIILDAQESPMYKDKYVQIEVFKGLIREELIDLAEKRNTSTQVDRLSIEELRNELEPFHYIFKNESWYSRLVVKQNQYKANVKDINMRFILSLFDMFNPEIVPNNPENQPIFTYSGKESSLKKFIDWKNKNQNIYKDFINNNAAFIIDIIELYDTLERDIPLMINMNGKRYGSLKFSKKSANKGYKSVFNKKKMDYYTPNGLIYPLINSFRALMKFDEKTKLLSWGEYSPIDIWKEHGKYLSNILFEGLRNTNNNPNALGKSKGVWNNLYVQLKLILLEKNNGH